MKNVDFVLLPMEKQATLLHRDGVYLGKLKGKSETVVFFQLESFYVAVSYLQYRKKIASVQCFDSTDVLDPFLIDIDIEELISQ